MQLRRGLRVLRCAPDEVQIGTDPRWAVRLGGLTEHEVDQLLDAGDTPLDGRLRPPALDGLATAGLLRPRDLRPVAPRPGTVAEAHAAGLIRLDGDPGEALRRRLVATVRVVGLDRVGAQVALGLALAGVGAVLLEDGRTVGRGDLGSGVRASDVGTPRATAVARAVREAAPRTRVSRRGARPPDVVVTVSDEATDPGTGLELMGADIAHLPVVLRAADSEIGPFVEPGRSPCLRCVELHRTDLDPVWPVLLAQLTAVRAEVRSPGVPAALAAVTAGMATAEVLAHLDGDVPGTRGATYEIALPGAEPRRRAWAAHPDCGCAALPA
ncbi:MAG TPA: ThiF family adenylyltransferase [Cellulomonas sp.]